jgi:hypothetical protein
MIVIKSGACGNSPKNAFAEDFVAELLAGAVETLQPKLAKSVRFLDAMNMAKGPDELMRLLRGRPWGRLRSVQITHALTHGRVGAVTGTMQSSEGAVEVCVVVEFENLKCRSVSSIRIYRL